jgi:hypothetical protein
MSERNPTTLELARRIADAVMRAGLTDLGTELRVDSNMDDPATQAVLRTLRDYDSWFCRGYETPAGTVD